MTSVSAFGRAECTRLTDGRHLTPLRGALRLGYGMKACPVSAAVPLRTGAVLPVRALGANAEAPHSFGHRYPQLVGGVPQPGFNLLLRHCYQSG
jgi:hypothetical protein